MAKGSPLTNAFNDDENSKETTEDLGLDEQSPEPESLKIDEQRSDSDSNSNINIKKVYSRVYNETDDDDVVILDEIDTHLFQKTKKKKTHKKEGSSSSSSEFKLNLSTSSSEEDLSFREKNVASHESLEEECIMLDSDSSEIDDDESQKKTPQPKTEPPSCDEQEVVTPQPTVAKVSEIKHTLVETPLVKETKSQSVSLNETDKKIVLHLNPNSIAGNIITFQNVNVLTKSHSLDKVSPSQNKNSKRRSLTKRFFKF